MMATKRFRLRKMTPWRLLLLGAGMIGSAIAVRAQEGTGPLTPPPEHDVRRVTASAPLAEAPPSLPPQQIIRQFAQKEEEYAKMRARYGYKKTVKLTESGPEGNPSGEFQVTTLPVVASDGKLYERVVDQQPSTLRFLKLAPEDLNALSRIPSYPLAASQIEKYEITFVGRERVDELGCYMFRVKPKFVDGARE